MQPVSTGLLLHHRVGRLVPAPAEKDAQSEVPEWELRERRERGEEGRVEAEELGADGRNNLCFAPRPPSWHPRKRSMMWGRAVVSFVLSFVSPL